MTDFVFLIGARYRKKELKGIGREPRVFSFLFKTKLVLYGLLVLLDFGVIILAVIQVFNPDKAIFTATVLKPDQISNSRSANVGDVVTLLIVQLINLAVYSYAAILLFKEYVRWVSEAWYSHKLFIWSNLVFHSAHLAIFWSLHSKMLVSMTFLRCVCLLLISIG